ncbi:homeobox protein Hox-A2-like [Microplitis demolitor]|uniref:homeobox protein Hox-A2-like n=1 Tax=Microplitis demolitor TaxID=69319 RepID=UPI00235B5D27|nr:homeobox protein Hox-A2-like [Microplitis demolitor]
MSCNNLKQGCKEFTPSVEQSVYPSSLESISEYNYNQSVNYDQLTIFDADQKQQKQDHRQNNTSSLQKVEQASTEEKNNKRRARTAFTTHQLSKLEKIFCENIHICRPTKISTASRLNLSERQVEVWFQNRRMKAKHDKLKIAATNGKKILYPSKEKLNQFVATDAIKDRRVNTSGLSATIHYHQLLPNQDPNVRNDGNCRTNDTNYQTAYTGGIYCNQYNATTEYPANNSN